MTKTKPKLIIWDYDGVLSDSEKLWIKIWQDLINEKFDLGWDFETADKILGGLAVKTKIANLKEIGIELEVSDKALDAIADKGFDKVYGARPLRRAIQTKIEDKLSELILEDKVSGKCKVDFEGDEFTFTSVK